MLVVDDDEVIRQLIAVNLTLEGFDVDTAIDGQDCLDRVQTIAPDVITLDVMMPRLDGWETAVQLRKTPETAHIKVVLITARAQEDDMTHGASVGAGRDHDDLDVRGLRCPAQLDGGLPAVEPRHHDIQRDNVRRDRLHLVKAVLAVDRGVHVEPLEGEIHRDKLADHLVVVHDEHAPQTLRHAARLPCLATLCARNGPVPTDAPGLVPFRGHQAPIAQGIEHRPPEPGAQVRILLGALLSGEDKATRLTENVMACTAAELYTIGG